MKYKNIYAFTISCFLMLTGCSHQNENHQKAMPVYYDMGALMTGIKTDDVDGVSDSLNSGNFNLSLCSLRAGCPVHEARSPEMLEVLLNNGGSVHVQDESNRTGLYYVKTPRMARAFIQRGAEVSGKDKDPILNYWLREIPSKVEQEIFVDKIKVGLNAGMSKTRKSHDGLTPQMILERNYQKCKDILNGHSSVLVETELTQEENLIMSCKTYNVKTYPQLKELLRY